MKIENHHNIFANLSPLGTQIPDAVEIIMLQKTRYLNEKRYGELYAKRDIWVKNGRSKKGHSLFGKRCKGKMEKIHIPFDSPFYFELIDWFICDECGFEKKTQLEIV